MHVVLLRVRLFFGCGMISFRRCPDTKRHPVLPTYLRIGSPALGSGSRYSLSSKRAPDWLCYRSYSSLVVRGLAEGGSVHTLYSPWLGNHASRSYFLLAAWLNAPETMATTRYGRPRL